MSSINSNTTLYDSRVLRSHGVPAASLHDVFRATILAKITYCLPAWASSCLAADRAKLEILSDVVSASVIALSRDIQRLTN